LHGGHNGISHLVLLKKIDGIVPLPGDIREGVQA
jgi:hypothetical protein